MIEPVLNKLITSLKESSTLAINEKAKYLRSQGKDIVHFGFGQSPFPVHESIQKALRDNAFRKEYLPTLGANELRESICAFYKKHFSYDFNSDCVLIGPGSKELIFQALYVLEGPLLIPAPSWVSYGPQAHIRGKHVQAIQTQRDNGYKLTADELRAVCDSLIVNRQKILIINNPNNPTGAVYTDDEIKEISDVCREEGVVVISDEIYGLVNFNERFSPGFSSHYPEGTIVTGGLSKGHSAGGYRLGFLAVPDNFKPVIKTLMAMVSETFSAVSAPTQFAAIAAFDENNTDLIDYTLLCSRIHKAAGLYLQKRFAKMGAGCPMPEGAFYIFPDFTKFTKKLRAKGITSASQLCDAFLEEAGVATLPADDFYCPSDYLACRIATVDYDGEAVYNANLKEKALHDEFIEHHAPNLKLGADRIENFLNSL